MIENIICLSLEKRSPARLRRAELIRAKDAA
jgi:hypothetical protein